MTGSWRRAVFLDRDGVINRAYLHEGKSYPPKSLAEFELLPGVLEACTLLKKANFLLVVITNQPDVGRGTQDKDTVESMHQLLFSLLPLDRIEVCYDENNDFLYKPAPGMIQNSAVEFGVNLEASFMVGDRWRDVDCGKNAGCRTIFVDSGLSEPLHSEPDFKVGSLLEAASLILRAL